MTDFGWSYPAGCNSVPGDEDDIHPRVAEVMDELDGYSLSNSTLEKIEALVTGLACDADRECPTCLAVHAAEVERENEADGRRESHPTP